jgi:alpha-glucosidase
VFRPPHSSASVTARNTVLQRPIDASWWRSGVIYQIYPRSFADSNRDGVGDLAGVASRLDYLAWLGVDGIWLNPTMPSPNDDWGYDVSDYRGVHPELGDMSDLIGLVEAARGRGIAVLLDLVPNHTSERHPWFLDARTSRTARHRDWYVWVDPRPDGSPPNNWVSLFGGSAWELDRRTGQYYLHNFLVSQPDLNWWNEEVREAFDDIQRFWFDRGIAGFRIDVANGLVKDRELRDNPPVTDADPEYIRRRGQRPVFNMNRPEVHDVMRRWRRLADGYDAPRMLLGEAVLHDLSEMAAFYGTGTDELDLAFNFAFMFGQLDADELRGIVEETERAIPPGGWPAWTVSNHDAVRFATRMCDGDEARIRCALLAVLTLRGTPVLYYGDELGLPQTDVPSDRVRDPVGRDGARTPMPWRAAPGGGFTAPEATPWLPFGRLEERNVESQLSDHGSTLRFCRDAIALRRASRDLSTGSYESLPARGGAWAWRRGRATCVALNLSGKPASVEGLDGVVRLATRREREGERVDGGLSLGPWEGVVVLPS